MLLILVQIVTMFPIHFGLCVMFSFGLFGDGETESFIRRLMKLILFSRRIYPIFTIDVQTLDFFEVQDEDCELGYLGGGSKRKFWCLMLLVGYVNPLSCFCFGFFCNCLDMLLLLFSSSS